MTMKAAAHGPRIRCRKRCGARKIGIWYASATCRKTIARPLSATVTTAFERKG